jgi:uncharacterized protein (TIGR03435 family)
MRFTIVMALLAGSTLVSGQVPANPDAKPLPHFEVASVKGFVPEAGWGGRGTPASAEYLNWEMGELLRSAFGVMRYQLKAPEWVYSSNSALGSTRFTIHAKFPPGTPKDRVSLMLRSLLIERFGLKFHREVKELPVFALEVADKGPKLKKSDRDGNARISGQASIDLLSCTLDFFGDTLSQYAERLVIDRTNIEGYYDIKLRWARNESDFGPSLSDALRDQLGLKLVPTKAPIEFIVIDSLNRVPTEN